jgi:hypothetical protein
MTKLPIVLTISLMALGAAASGASAQSSCSGDFENVGGNWIATKYCQRAEAQKVARTEDMHITSHPALAHDETPGQFCRENVANIATSTYCASYNDND